MHTPTRTCASCRKKCKKCELIRISFADESPVIDQFKTNPHRAIYVCKDEKCISLLSKNKAIERFLKVNTEDKFYEELKEFAKREK